MSEESINYIERTYKVDFDLVSNDSPAFGDNIIYNLSTTCHTFILDADLELSIQRMTVVGYFN